MEEYPWSCLERRINGKDVTILGAWHFEPAFIVYENFYRGKIAEHDSLVVEAGTIDADPRSCTPRNQTSLTSNYFVKFFGPILDIAVDQNKKMFIADPFTEVARKGINLQERLSYVAGGAVASIGLGGYISQSTPVILSGWALMGGIVMTDALKALTPFLRWNYHDYRDIKIAQGIQRLCQRREEDRILAIHGEAHSKGISFYLDNPRLANLKLHSYERYERTARKQGTDRIRQIHEHTEYSLPISEEDRGECPDLTRSESTEPRRGFIQIAI